MAFKISNKGRTGEPANVVTDMFYTVVKRYLKGRQGHRRADRLYTHIQNGGKLAVFPCHCDYPNDIADELCNEGVAFLKVLSEQGRKGFIICSGDEKKAEAAVKRATKEHMVEKILVPVAGMSKTMRDKSLNNVVLSNFRFEKANYLRKLLQDRVKIREMGFDFQKGGKCRIGIYGEDLWKRYNGNSVASCIFETQLVFAGPDREGIINDERREIGNILTLHDAMEKGTDLDRPLYVVSRANEYARIDKDGIDYGEICVSHDGECVLYRKLYIQRGEMDYHHKEAVILYGMEPALVTFDASEAVLQASRNLEPRGRHVKYANLSRYLENRTTDRIQYDAEYAAAKDPGVKLDLYLDRASREMGEMLSEKQGNGFDRETVRRAAVEIGRMSCVSRECHIVERGAAARDIVFEKGKRLERTVTREELGLDK